NEIDFRSVSSQQSQVLSGCFHVDDTDEPEAVIGARLGQAHAHVAGARFNDDRTGFEQAGAHRVLDDVCGGAIFHAAARVESFEFGKHLEVQALGKFSEAYQRCVADSG